MGSGKLSAIAFIAIILGAVGAGVGGYAAVVMLTGGADGDDGDDGDDGAAGTTTTINKIEGTYPCASEAEINNAITAIGTGFGKILITKNITISATIDVDGGGSYIIEGVGLPTIESGGNFRVFYITDADSCIIRDLILDGSAITGGLSIIYIDEIIDNPILIDNVRILNGPSSIGINIYSNDVTVKNSIIIGAIRAISLLTVDDTKIYNNEILDCSMNGIYMNDGDNGLIYNNYIDVMYGDYGIYFLESDVNVFSYNIIKNFDYEGIYIDTGSAYNDIIGNQISDSASYSYGANRTCILIQGDDNEVIDNSCINCKNSAGSNYGHGIYLTSSAVSNNIVGNNLIDNDISLCNLGISNTVYGNNAP
ncbi:MAG: right-handed parallel beta-helix repeat-containing protein [Candidatus Hodarchaeota archaeon]